MFRLRFSLFVFLSSCVSFAAAAPVVRLTQTVKTKVCKNGACTFVDTMIGVSGTCIGRDKDGRLVILSCGHVIESGVPVTVELDREHVGKSEQGTVLSIDKKLDLSLILLDHKEPVELYPVADAAPRHGTPVRLIGYPKGVFSSNAAKILNYHKNNMTLSAPVASGTSGGAVVCGNKLVGVIWGTADMRDPINQLLGNHSFAAHVSAVQGFVIGALGYPPLLTPVAQKPADNIIEQPVVTPPLPAATLPQISAEEIRAIVSAEVAKIPSNPAPQTVDAAKLKADVLSGVSDQLAAHKDQLTRVIADSAAAGKFDPAAFQPILQSVATGAAKEVGTHVAGEVLPSVLTAIASHLGMGALAGSVGGPIGALAGGAIGLVGFFLNKTLKKNLQKTANRIGPDSDAQPIAAQSMAPSPAPRLVITPAAVAPTETKYVGVPVADSLANDLNSALDAEVALNPALAAVVSRARNSAGIIHRARNVSSPSPPLV